MSTLNVKVPDEMDEDIEAFLDDRPHYLNKSELVRDAVRHLIEQPKLSERTLEDDRISRQQIENGNVTSLEDL
ncbi:ribbon-helix-helix domain-containing protein [Halococcoides cellulosivorans]|uniref:Uncharacterized protein n=1 Tax=Halococcoides cellulosivorans TaxID=1679096 RepID=A0A2R4WYH1_9EURY|nr:ribbon-helix-helix domain-containing protein [Halococcoides cellulosivorans]AWB26582.1 hypothetical protein HARCEL1_02070 [Halococcoides cellulosivorans]